MNKRPKSTLKTGFFTLTFLATGLACQAQLVKIPDANFKTALLNHDPVIDTNTDGEIQVAEAEAFTGFMNVSSKGITNITGLDAFINLTRLHCTSNLITDLDISANQKLIELRCFQNPLGSLDVSQNVALQNLSSAYNQLTSLDVSQNVNLTTLVSTGNPITTLDVSQNTKLVQLSCLESKVTKLELAQCVDLERLLCQNNPNLKQVIISNGNNANFTLFYCDNVDSLECIQIDENFSPPVAWIKPAGASYSEDCNPSASVETEHLENAVSVYPNPAASSLHIATSKQITRIAIVDMAGREVRLVSPTASAIDIVDLNRGMYLLKLQVDNTFITKRFLKN